MLSSLFTFMCSGMTFGFKMLISGLVNTLGQYKYRLLYLTIYLQHIKIPQKSVNMMMVEFMKLENYLVHLLTQNS